MSEKGKNILLGVLIVGLVSMTVAYAALSQILTINGSATIAKSSDSWNVHFDTTTTPSVTRANNGYVTATEVGTLTTADYTAPTVALTAPNDYSTFTWKVVNDGTINARLTAASNLAADGTLSGYTVTYSDDTELSQADAAWVASHLQVTLTYAGGTNIVANSTTGDILAAHNDGTTDEATLVLKVALDNAEDMPGKTANKSLKVTGITTQFTYSQSDR